MYRSAISTFSIELRTGGAERYTLQARAVQSYLPRSPATPSLPGRCKLTMVAQRTAKRLLLGREIHHLLTEAGMTQAEAAELIETRQSRIADLIAGIATISPGDLKELARGLGVTDPGYIDELLSLRRDNHKRGFWTTGHRRAYHEDFRLLVDLESHADLIRWVGHEMMPGLAQCEAYIRAQFQARDDRTNHDDGATVEDLVQARLARQNVVLEESTEYRVVMSESCLRRQRGGPDVMREQIDYLTKLSKRTNVLLQLIPFRSQSAPSIENRFAMVRVPSPGYAGPLELAYVEGVGEIRYLDESEALAAHDAAWARLSSAALNPADTRQFMKHVAATFR